MSVLDRGSGAEMGANVTADASGTTYGAHAAANGHDSDAAPARRTALRHQPALDGLRGLAVAAVVFYHAADADHIDWMKPWSIGPST